MHLGSAMFAAFVSAAAPGAAPGEDAQARATSAGYASLRGFASVLVTHVNRVMGTENLPPFVGKPVRPGLVVTADASRIQLFDRFSLPLSGGRVRDPSPAPACASGCPASLFDTFRRWWFELGVESRSHAVQLPGMVLIAAHRELPAATLTQIAYAASESRPVQPPNVALLTHGGPAGIRALPLFLVRPGGLELPPGSRALGLTIHVGPSKLTVTAASPAFGRTLEAASLQELAAIVRDVHRHHPNKSAIVYRFDPQATVGQFVQVYATVRGEFPVAVLGDDEPIRVR